MFIGRTDAEAETPILWPPDSKSWLSGKDPDAGKDRRWEEKGTREDETLGWHYRLNGREFVYTLAVVDEQGGLACYTVHEVAKSRTWLIDWTELMGPEAMIFVCWMLSFKPVFSLPSFAFMKRLFSSSSLSAIREVSSAYLKSESESCSVVSDSLQPHGLYSPWNSPGQNTGVGSLSFLQRIFPTQGSNPGLCTAGRFFTNWAIREALHIWDNWYLSW